MLVVCSIAFRGGISLPSDKNLIDLKLRVQGFKASFQTQTHKAKIIYVLVVGVNPRGRRFELPFQLGPCFSIKAREVPLKPIKQFGTGSDILV